MRMEEGGGLWEDEGDVVHAGREAGVVWRAALLPWLAIEQSEADGEE